MTTFSKDNLPASVDTLEKLSAWVGAAFHQINKTATANEGAGAAQKVAQFGIFNVDSNNTSRLILRHSLELDEKFAIDSKPIWENVKETSFDAIPSAFLAS